MSFVIKCKNTELWRIPKRALSYYIFLLFFTGTSVFFFLIKKHFCFLFKYYGKKENWWHIIGNNSSLNKTNINERLFVNCTLNQRCDQLIVWLLPIILTHAKIKVLCSSFNEKSINQRLFANLRWFKDVVSYINILHKQMLSLNFYVVISIVWKLNLYLPHI